MKTIYLTINGILTQILNIDKFQLYNWAKFKKGEKVYFEDTYFATFVSYEKNKIYEDEIIKLEIIQ